jgi:hypothetical protein
MNTDATGYILSERLKRLIYLRGEIDKFFNEVEEKTKKELAALIADQKSTMFIADVAAQVLAGIAGLAQLCSKAAASMGKVGRELAELNKDQIRDLGIEFGVKKPHSLLSTVFGSEEDPWVNFAMNFMNPSYWVELGGYGPVSMTRIYDDVIREIAMQRAESLAVIDRRIKAVDQLRKATDRGIDLSTLA